MKNDRVLKDEEADDLYQMEIDSSRKEIDKARAYVAFFEDLQRTLLSFGAKTAGDLPSKEQTIIAQKHEALVEKYGPAHNSVPAPGGESAQRKGR